MSDGGEERGFFGQCAAVTDHGKSVHLEAIVVVETKGLVLYDTWVELESALFDTFTRTWVATVEDGHVVLSGHAIDGVEEGEEVFLRVDVLLAMGGQKDITAFLQSETLMNVAGFDFGEILGEPVT